MTPQDIREMTFEKAVFGGYDMGGVDDFMEEAAAELEAAQKESAVLKSKIKVLVDKVEEYRASEDAMRMTLLSAQKLSAQIESEAKARAEATIADADATAARALGALKTDTAREEARLREARAACVKFFDQARMLCSNQLDYLDKLSVDDLPVKEEVIDSTVKSIEASVARIPDEPAPRIDISPAMEDGPVVKAPRAPEQTSLLYDTEELR